MKLTRFQFAAGGLAVALLALILTAFGGGGRASSEDRQAQAWLESLNRTRSFGAFTTHRLSVADVSAAALVRAMLRHDPPLTRVYRRVWDVLPSWIKHRLPRPLDERTRALLVNLALRHHDAPAGALPVLAAAVTDPGCVNRARAVVLLGDLGAWLPAELLQRASQGLQDTNAVVRLRVLESLEKVWPGQPDLRRRIGELQREVKP